MNETASSASSAPASAPAPSLDVSPSSAPTIEAPPATPAFEAAANAPPASMVETAPEPAPTPDQSIATIAELRARETVQPPTPQPALTPEGTEWIAAIRQEEIGNQERIAELRQQLGDADRTLNTHREAALDRPAFDAAHGFER